MGIFKGALSVRRYRVDGEAPDGFRDLWRDALDAHAFRPPLSALHKEEIAGWVLAHNLLLLLSVQLEAEGIRDEKVEQKYAAALKVRETAARLAGRRVSPWVGALRQATRWSSQLTRWLQDALTHDWDWSVGLEKLRPLMAGYMR